MVSFACNDLLVDFHLPYPGCVTITLNKPATHNAFDEVLIADLTRILKALAEQENVKIVCLQAQGKSFCAGADLQWMQRMQAFSAQQNLADAQQLSDLMLTLATLPQPTIAIVQGAAFGGGVGLMACCDLVIASENAQFCLSEVKLGLAPAVISPYLVQSIGLRQAKRLMLTAENISSELALQLGLIHYRVALTDLITKSHALIKSILENGPVALKTVKKCCALIEQAHLKNAVTQELAQIIAQLRISPEAQEGMRAFFEKRKPDWR